MSVTLLSSYAHSAPLITFSCGLSPDIAAYKELENRYRQAFANMGYDFLMVPASSQRSFVNVSNGIVDGDCIRTENFKEMHPEAPLHRVDVYMGSSELSVWSFTDKIQLKNAEDIKKGKFQVGLVRGNAVTEKYIADNKINNTLLITDLSIAIKMLSAQRFDLLIAPDVLIHQQLTTLKLNHPIYRIGVLLRFKAYPYLNESRADLLPEFTQQLQKLVPKEGIPLD